MVCTLWHPHTILNTVLEWSLPWLTQDVDVCDCRRYPLYSGVDGVWMIKNILVDEMSFYYQFLTKYGVSKKSCIDLDLDGMWRLPSDLYGER